MWLVARGEDASVAGRIYGGVSGRHIELHQDGGDVVLDGAVRDKEPVGDLGVGETSCKQFEDFGLPGR